MFCFWKNSERTSEKSIFLILTPRVGDAIIPLALFCGAWILNCEHAGTGRQARLRGVCLITYGFKSHCSHQKMQSARSVGCFFCLRLGTWTCSTAERVPLLAPWKEAEIVSISASFQLNPSFRTGEIILTADEIPKGMKSPTAMKDGFDFTFEQSEKISSELARISSQVPKVEKLLVIASNAQQPLYIFTYRYRKPYLHFGRK